MTIPKILVLSAQPEQNELTTKDFEGSKILNVDSPDMTYYVAQDSEGDVQGTALIKPNDRKTIGALVGNWIASGFAVSRMTYKAMNKLLRELQKAKEASVEQTQTVIQGQTQTVHQPIITQQPDDEPV